MKRGIDQVSDAATPDKTIKRLALPALPAPLDAHALSLQNAVQERVTKAARRQALALIERPAQSTSAQQLCEQRYQYVMRVQGARSATLTTLCERDYLTRMMYGSNHTLRYFELIVAVTLLIVRETNEMLEPFVCETYWVGAIPQNWTVRSVRDAMVGIAKRLEQEGKREMFQREFEQWVRKRLTDEPPEPPCFEKKVYEDFVLLVLLTRVPAFTLYVLGRRDRDWAGSGTQVVDRPGLYRFLFESDVRSGGSSVSDTRRPFRFWSVNEMIVRMLNGKPDEPDASRPTVTPKARSGRKDRRRAQLGSDGLYIYGDPPRDSHRDAERAAVPEQSVTTTIDSIVSNVRRLYPVVTAVGVPDIDEWQRNLQRQAAEERQELTALVRSIHPPRTHVQ